MARGKKGQGGRNILAAILCIPLAFIIYYAISFSSESISLGNIRQVSVDTPNGTSYTYDSVEDVDFFVSMLQNSKHISSAIRDVSGEHPVYIIFDRGDKNLQYKFYPTLNVSGCLLSDPSGKLMLLDPADAGKLLLKDQFSYLYNACALPDLFVVSGEHKEAVVPAEYDWKYKKSDDRYYDYLLPADTVGKELYSIFKGFENTLEFSIEPDELTDITYVTQSGVPLSVSSISSFDFSADTVINVSFVAKWNNTNSSPYYGTARYSFDLLYDIPATIALDKTEVTQGEFLTITASHLNKNETVTLDTMLKTTDLSFEMTGEDTGVALLPIDVSNAPGAYTLSLVSGNSTVTETITVLARESSWTPIPVTTDEYYAHLSPEKIALFEQALADATKQRDGERYFEFSDGLRSPVGDKEVIHSFGATVNFANSAITGDSGNRIVTEKVYSLSESTSVRSAQAGKVVFCSKLDTTGGTIIIYHGYGIYSCYFHLAEPTIAFGTTVTDGEIIGTAGSTGFTSGKTVLGYMVCIDGIPIDPDLV